MSELLVSMSKPATGYAEPLMGGGRFDSNSNVIRLESDGSGYRQGYAKIKGEYLPAVKDVFVKKDIRVRLVHPDNGKPSIEIISFYHGSNVYKEITRELRDGNVSSKVKGNVICSTVQEFSDYGNVTSEVKQQFDIKGQLENQNIKRQQFDSMNNLLRRVETELDANNEISRQTVTTQKFNAKNDFISGAILSFDSAGKIISEQEMTPTDAIIGKVIKKDILNSSIGLPTDSKSSLLPKADTSVLAETRMKSELLDNKPIRQNRTYETIDGKRFLVTKDEFINEGTRVQQVRRDNSRFIAEITKNHQDGQIVSQTVKVRELDSATKKYFLSAQYETVYTYDAENNKNTTHSNSKLYGRDGKLISIQDVSVINEEIISDATVKFDSNGYAYNYRFLNSDGKYENSRLNSTINDIDQLADATNSFPTKESTPAPVDNIISSQIPERHRSIVPDRRYPI
ncbi:MAG: hypothetical protein ACH344_10250 [Yersinia sp. (in: enterobacteria)]